MTDDDAKIRDQSGNTFLRVEASCAYSGHLYLHLSRNIPGDKRALIGGHFPTGDVLHLVKEATAVEIKAEEILGGGQHSGADLEQVGGSHYIAHKIRPWDIIDEYGLNFYEGNIVKYLLREKAGNSRLEELKKLRHYADKLIQLEEGA